MKLVKKSIWNVIHILAGILTMMFFSLLHLGVVHAVTIPDSSYTDAGIVYTFTSDGHGDAAANVESYHISEMDASGVVTIPGQIEVPSAGSIKVTGILQGAFKGCHSLKEITLPHSIDYIGQEAFCNCTGLTAIHSTLNPNLAGYLTAREIGYRAFYGCSQLQAVRLGESTNGGVETVQSEAFMNCTSLRSVQIDNTVDWIDSGAFANCTSLDGANVTVLDNAKYFVQDGILYYRENDSSVVLVCCPANTNAGELSKFPNNVTQIRKQAFYGCKLLTSVVIPSTVTTIGDQAFTNCSQLLSVNVPDSVTNVGYQVFANCNNNLEIVCNSGSFIDKYALANSLNRSAVCTVTFVNTYTNATVSVAVKSGEKAAPPTGWGREGYILEWSNGFNENMVISSSMTVSTVWKRLYTVTFRDKDFGQQMVLNGIEEGASVTPPNWTRKGYILTWSTQDYMSVHYDMIVDANWLFSMTDAEISPERQTTYNTGSEFVIGKLKYRVASETNRMLTVVGISGNKVSSITIPDKLTVNGAAYKVTRIAANAFRDNKKLKKVTIGSKVLSIGKCAFLNCKNLKKIVIRSKVLDTIGNKAFKNTPAKLKVTAPTKSRANTYRIMMMDAGLNSKATVVKSS